MRRLTATAEQLAAGDLTARSRLSPSSDEVGQLASSFDHMADRIQEAFAAQQESEAQVRRFIDDASHELRTPVTALKGYIDVLRRGAGREPAALDAALEAMSNESERMRMLVLDLLTLARLDARRESHPEDFDLNDAVDALLNEGVPGMPDTVQRTYGAPQLFVHADRGAVNTIMRNLLVNACKYAHGAAQRWTTSGSRARGHGSRCTTTGRASPLATSPTCSSASIAARRQGHARRAAAVSVSASCSRSRVRREAMSASRAPKAQGPR